MPQHIGPSSDLGALVFVCVGSPLVHAVPGEDPGAGADPDLSWPRTSHPGMLRDMKWVWLNYKCKTVQITAWLEG